MKDKVRYFVMGPKNYWASSDYWFYKIVDSEVFLVDRRGNSKLFLWESFIKDLLTDFDNYKEIEKEELPFY